jgi:pumilio homology domain family member 6
LTNELHVLFKRNGNYKRLALAHDTSRIIQWLIKYGSDEVRIEASADLAEITAAMLQSKYARNTVKRILKYGKTPTRNNVLKAFNGSVVKLASHSMSSAILDYAYGEIASKPQKQLLQQEFYGDIYRIVILLFILSA